MEESPNTARPKIDGIVYRKARVAAALKGMHISEWIELAIEEKFVKDFQEESSSLNVLVVNAGKG